jgi:hypothetical protein
MRAGGGGSGGGSGGVRRQRGRAPPHPFSPLFLGRRHPPPANEPPSTRPAAVQLGFPLKTAAQCEQAFATLASSLPAGASTAAPPPSALAAGPTTGRRVRPPLAEPRPDVPPPRVPAAGEEGAALRREVASRR